MAVATPGTLRLTDGRATPELLRIGRLGGIDLSGNGKCKLA